MARAPFRQAGVRGRLACRGRRVGVGAVGEVEAALRVREQAQGGRLPLVEGSGVAEAGEDAGQVGEGGLQVERVEGVQAGGEVGGGGRGAVVEPDATGVQGGLFDAGGLVGVAAQHGLVDQLVEPARRQGPVAGGDHRQVPVHEVHRGPRQGGGVSGDLSGLPGLQPALVHQGPQPREPEAELDGLADQPQGRGVGEGQGGGEGLQGVLGDPGGAVPTQPLRAVGLQARARGQGRDRDDGRGGGGTGERVQVDPVHGQCEQPGLLAVRGPAGLGDRGEDLGGREVTQLEVVLHGAGHDPNLGVTTDSSGSGIPLSTRGNATFWQRT